MKGLIYKAVFGGYDKQRPIKAPEGISCLMINDQQDAPQGWLHSRMEPVISPQWMNRFLKMNLENLMPDKKFDWILYLDGSLHPKKELWNFINELNEHCESAVFNHPERKTIDQELSFLARTKKMDRFEVLSTSDCLGLFAGGFFFRKPTSILREKWWSEFVAAGSVRDQLTLPFAIDECRRLEERIRTVAANIWSNPWMEWVPHGK